MYEPFVEFALLLACAAAGALFVLMRWVICTLPQRTCSRSLLHGLGEAGYGGDIDIVARDAEQAAAKTAGVAPVLQPFDDAADHAARQLSELLRPVQLSEETR